MGEMVSAQAMVVLRWPMTGSTADRLRISRLI
jgi:hypothetical protein